MRYFALTFLLLVSCTALFAQQPNYDASLIPKELLPYASAVVRDDEVSVEVKGLDNTVYHFRSAVTVLNKNGDAHARLVIWYNKSNIIKGVKGLIFDEKGMQTGKFSERDLRDEDAANDFSLFEDSRVKYYTPTVTTYPYTITYEYELRSKQTLNFGDWVPNPGLGIAIEKSSYTFACKPDFTIRYKETNIPGKVVIATNAAGLKTYSWHIGNMKAVRSEPYSPIAKTYVSSVKIAPEKFTYEGINGSFTNWNELGKWMYDKLLFNRDQLYGETPNIIKNLTKDITDPKEKARKIYEYMQQKSRYISIQIGIGGFQPFTASEVDKLSYGDCKGLVYYTQALLKVVGIDSYYCVVEAGDEKVSMLPDFASMDQANHVILCIPFKNDTTWLECTSQKIPFGFLSNFTDDRIVLACTAQGGKLMHTPKYTAQDNLQTRRANFTISAAGELSGEMETTFKGTQYDNRESVISGSPTEQVKGLKYIYPINNLDIGKFSFKQDKSVKPTTTEDLKLTARDYASADDNKLNFMINPVNRSGRTPRDVRNRQNDVYINEGYTDDDEITYNLPKGYHFDKLPLSIKIEKPFGSYSVNMTLKDDKLVYKRKIQLIDGNYSKDTYSDLVAFYEKVVEADHYSVSLSKAVN